MITTKKLVEAHRLIHLLIQTAHRSEAFKRKLINDPVRTIEKVTGQRSHFPKGVRIQVEDQSDPKTIFLNLPINPNR